MTMASGVLVRGVPEDYGRESPDWSNEAHQAVNLSVSQKQHLPSSLLVATHFWSPLRFNCLMLQHQLIGKDI